MRKKCSGPTRHAKGCRKGRPHCRWSRPSPCCCEAYPYPHRRASGACWHGIPAAILNSPSYKEQEDE